MNNFMSLKCSCVSPIEKPSADSQPKTLKLLKVCATWQATEKALAFVADAE